MQTVFLLVYFVGLAYLACARRRFDMHAIAFLAACVYFMPGLYGYTLYPAGLFREQVPLAETTYAVMTFVLGTVALGMFVVDTFGGGPGPRTVLRHAAWLGPVIVGLAGIGFIFTLATSGTALLAADKSAMMATLNRGHILWTMASVLGLAIAFAERRWKLAVVPVLLLLANLYIGFRSALAVALVSLVVVHLARDGRRRFMFAHFRLVLTGALFALGFFAYKRIYIAVKLGRLDLLRDKFADSEFLTMAVGQSEPFTTQAILDAVVRSGFTAPPGHFMAVLHQVIVFAPALGARTQSFNDLMQPQLFPHQIGGMASNVWAEMYATGGWLLLGAFLLLFNIVLAVMSRLIRAADPRLCGLFATTACYWAFYIHRNDLAYQLNLEKRLALIFLCAWFVSSGALIAVRAWSRHPFADETESPTGEDHATP